MLAHAGGAPEFVSTALVAAGFVAGWIGWSRLRGRGFARLPGWGGVTLLAVAPVALVASILLPSRLWPPPAAVRPTSTATLSFIEPTPGEAVTSDMLDVRMRLDGGTIVQSSSTDLRPDTGHIHVLLDEALVSMTYGTEQRIPITGLSPGPHRLRAEFVAADHAPFDPRVIAEVTFVRGGG